jgi:superfamily II DNA or RNA helicase
MNFVERLGVKECSWQAFERMLARLLTCEGYQNVRQVGGSGDHGADVIATKYNKRWLIQAKQWKKPVGINVLNETLAAMKFYQAAIPVIAASNGFDADLKQQQIVLQSQGIPLQLWDSDVLLQRASRLQLDKVINTKEPREYQKDAIKNIIQPFFDQYSNRSLIVLATGLGKTFVAAEAMRRISSMKPIRVLVLAHTNSLVYQLEKSFWPFLTPEQSTLVWNGYEHPDMNRGYDYVFACIDTVYEAFQKNITYDFDAIIIDECHHAGSASYRKLIEYYDAGKNNGPFLLGLTATPWRPDENDIKAIFGDPRITIDMVFGMRHGFLTNVDYRMYTDNIDWNSLKRFDGKLFSPRQINRTLFINQWDDAVVTELQKAWYEQQNPRAIVFCGTIDHAIKMRDRINALGFCNAAAVFAGSKDAPEEQPFYERNKIMCDFSDGIVNVVCAVDVFNEGIDVPDVNIIVFQRVTHSRRIFIQQLGRGLRISDDKDKVIVLDFVSDIRRFAAGIDLKDRLSEKEATRVNIPNKVTFRKVGGEDPQTEKFLREWLDDVASIEEANEDSSVLKFPPQIIS